MEIRLNKLISEAGVCSRREADNFIEMERVTVNGKQPHVGQKVTAEDVVLVDGERLNVEKYIRLQEEEKKEMCIRDRITGSPFVSTITPETCFFPLTVLTLSLIHISFLPTAAPVTLMPVLLDILLFPCASVITGENDNRILLQT